MGFFPVKQVWRERDGWLEAVKELGLSTEDAAMVRRLFLIQEQIELSSVVIGSNAKCTGQGVRGGRGGRGDAGQGGLWR